MPSRQRARKDEQKQERRQAILDAAWALFQERSYQALTMADVAERTGLAKGTLYLYFKTKEALFLAIQEQELWAWFEEVDGRLLGAGAGCEVPQIAAILCQSLAARPGLTRLFAILPSVLEQNIDLDTARRFKQALLGAIQRSGALLERCLPFLAPGQGATFLQLAHAVVIGLHQLAEPAPVVRDLLVEPGMEVFAFDFAETLAVTLRALLYGLEREAALGPASL